MTPMKRCIHPGCRVLIPFTERYCEKHIGTVNQVYNKYYDNKDKEIKKFYNSKGWQNTRRYTMIHYDWMCQMCERKGLKQLADMVDHIIPVRMQWSKRLEFNNLQPLCNGCHNKKTADDKKRYD